PYNDWSNHKSPEITDNYVTWLDDRGEPVGDYTVGIYDLANETELNFPQTSATIIPISASALPDELRISGNRIIWHDRRSGPSTIYLSTLGVNKTCPVADFNRSPESGSPGLRVNFTDNSTYASDNPIQHYFWDFKDSNTSILRNPVNIFGPVGRYPVSLTVSNLLCRNITPMDDRYNITIGPPTASFTATPTTGLIPLSVHFADTSSGSPTSWNWSFGDGTYSNTSTATHVFMTKGNFIIRLNVTNSFGSSTAQSSIIAMQGMNATENTTIPGLTIVDSGGRQFLALDYLKIPNWSFMPNASVLEFTSSNDSGFANITVYGLDGIGFRQDVPTHTIQGNVTGTQFHSNNLPLVDLSPTFGPDSSFNFTLINQQYPENALLNTQIWEGATSSDALNFMNVIAHSGFGSWYGTAYTAKITKTNVPPNATARLFMSVNASWDEAISNWQNRTDVVRVTDDGNYGEVLPLHFLYKDVAKNIDYFEADSPHGLSTFGLSQTTGSGNPFQLITLTIAAHVNQPSASIGSPSYSSGGGSSSPPPPSPVQTPVPPDAEKSIKLYSNPSGIISQQSILFSADNRVNLTIGTGILALDSSGKPLTNVTIKALPAEKLPNASPGNGLVFAGMAYDFMPDGATFSPGITVSFRIPDSGAGLKYTVKSYDRAKGAWEDLPAVYDPVNGALSTQIPHFCCIALFSQSLAGAAVQVTPAITPSAVPPVTPAPSIPPTAISIVSGMVFWVSGLLARNPVIFAAGVILVISLVFLRYRRMR
ncbi:MAG TPA: PKD domain-containing protein, partial [Methanoregula sp.]|nr:PKD domain-containing protein [Methanoregula sp.]